MSVKTTKKVAFLGKIWPLSVTYSIYEYYNELSRICQISFQKKGNLELKTLQIVIETFHSTAENTLKVNFLLRQ